MYRLKKPGWQAAGLSVVSLYICTYIEGAITIAPPPTSSP
jgi:hypothetical protein